MIGIGAELEFEDPIAGHGVGDASTTDDAEGVGGTEGMFSCEIGTSRVPFWVWSVVVGMGFWIAVTF